MWLEEIFEDKNLGPREVLGIFPQCTLPACWRIVIKSCRFKSGGWSVCFYRFNCHGFGTVPELIGCFNRCSAKEDFIMLSLGVDKKDLKKDFSFIP